MPDDSNAGTPPALAGCKVEEMSLPQLVGEVYKAAPATEKMRLLEFLLPTLGVMPLIVIANGLFARLRFRDGWSNYHARLDEVQQVLTSDIVSLVEQLMAVLAPGARLAVLSSQMGSMAGRRRWPPHRAWPRPRQPVF